MSFSLSFLVTPSLGGLPLKNDNYSYKAAKLKRKNGKRLTNGQKKFQVYNSNSQDLLFICLFLEN